MRATGGPTESSVKISRPGGCKNREILTLDDEAGSLGMKAAATRPRAGATCARQRDHFRCEVAGNGAESAAGFPRPRDNLSTG